MLPSVHIDTFVLGQIQNNTYLISDERNQQAVVIDPAAGISELVAVLNQKRLQLSAIWITHAHFDHIAGVYQLLHTCGSDVPLYLHPDDLPLWRSGAGARDFGFDFDPRVEPNAFFQHGQLIPFAGTNIAVRHTPGHAPGHVLLYWEEQQVAFCGDLIFYHSVGRTDLPQGDETILMRSIQNEVLTLPDLTTLLSGHGPATTVGEERKNNPFLY
ncbi:MAG TPA: MBL fold metallo-hydrolase [Anaerolineaceae bacterium]|jgi:hydroxyacylglutathione hydrolase|nr:MBL fold metallo-hydrolase [Anaerolineaceae bacterium]